MTLRKPPPFLLLALAALLATAAAPTLLAPPVGAAVGACLAFAVTAEAALRREARRVLTFAFVAALGVGLLVGAGGGGLGEWAVYGVALVFVGELIGARAARLHRQAVTDPLTGLLNREGLREAAATAVASCRKRDLPLTLVHLDLDHFKDVNDSFGHVAGDRVLRESAERWSTALGAGDTLARVGGDEFLFLLPGSDRAAAERLVERLRFRSPIGWSHGSAELGPDDDLESCLLHADAALYAAKDRRDPRRCRSARAAGDDHREAVVLPEAVDVGEARLAQPTELVLDRGGAVDPHPLDRGQPLLVGGAARLRLALVPTLVGVVEEGGRAGDLLRVDEDPARPEPFVQAAEQRRLRRVVEVVDGQRADDRVPGFIAR
jgi:diguanylate cyclase (GGDEF)-like protein